MAVFTDMGQYLDSIAGLPFSRLRVFISRANGSQYECTAVGLDLFCIAH